MSISVMIDVVIAAVLAVCAAAGWKSGLIRGLVGLAATVLALLLAVQLAGAAAPEIVDRYLRPATHAAIERRAEEIAREADETTRENLHQLMEAIPNGFIRSKAVETVDGLFESGQILGGYAFAPLAELGEEVADQVLDTLVRDVLRSILCAALFVVLSFLFRLIARVLRIVEKIPGVRQLNELGGALAGLGKGLILVCLAVWVLRHTGVLTPEMADGSIALGLLPGWIGGTGK